MKKINIPMPAFHCQQKAQSMAEFCVAAPLLVLLLWSIIYLTEMYIAKHDTLVAARYGTWLLSRHDNIPENSVDIDEVRGLISRHFFDNSSEGLLVTNQPDGIGSSGFNEELTQSTESVEWVDQIVGFIGENLMGTDTPNLYSLKVQYDYPRLFGAVDLRQGEAETFTIESEHFVIGNSWDGQRVEVHDIIDMLGNVIEEIFDGF
jgi:hypothetical protein